MSLVLKHVRDKKELDLKPTYVEFQKYMEKLYKVPKETKYIYKDNKGSEFIVQSKESYDQMKKCLISKPTYVELKETDAKRKCQNENEDEEKSVIFLDKNGDKVIIDLPSTFEDFSKKMQNSQVQKKETKYLYEDNNHQPIIIETSSQYDQMIKCFKQWSNKRILKVKEVEVELELNKEEELDKEEQIMNETKYPELFFGEKKLIDCVCKKLGKSPLNCPYCKESTQIDYQQELYNELNQEFRLIFKRNFPKIKKYIKDKYEEDINDFTQWLVFHSQLLNFEETQKEFNFKCIACGIFQPKKKVVYVKSKQIPQNPVCYSCFPKQKNQEEFIKLGNFQEDQIMKLGNFQEDEIFIQPPKLQAQ